MQATHADAELVQLWDQYLEAYKARQATDDDEQPEKAEAAFKAECAIERQIMEAPAHGLVGFAIKMRILADYAIGYQGERVDRFIIEMVKAVEEAAGLPHDPLVYGALPLSSELRPPEMRFDWRLDGAPGA